MFEVVVETKSGKVIIELRNDGKPVSGYTASFPLEKKKEWESFRKYCAREADARNKKSGRKV